MSTILKTLVAGLATATVALAFAQGTPPNPAAANPALGAGRHEELLARGGRYADLYNRQYGVEANLFRNPGETAEEPEAEKAPTAPADATVARLPLVG